MAIYIYLRVSTSAQDTQNQLHGIQQYCQERGIEPNTVVECQSARNFDHLSALNFDQVSGGYCGA